MRAWREFADARSNRFDPPGRSEADSPIMLLDTRFFIDLEDELRAARPGPCSAFLLENRHQTKHASVITIGEFAAAATAAATLRFFRGYQRLSLGRDVAIFGGRLQAALAFDMGENDLWIAATAKFHGLPVVSRDKVFSRVPGLKVLAY
jgi:predicted nucleic acid-binding protein